MNLKQLRESKIFALLLSAMLVLAFSGVLTRFLFDTPANLEVIRHSKEVLEQAVRKEDFGSQIIIYNHGGQVGVSQKFATAATYEQIRVGIKERIVFSHVQDYKNGFRGCVDSLQFSFDYVEGRNLGYVIQVVNNKSAVQPIGCL